MKKVEGNTGVRLLECINPIKNKWRVRWDVQPGENGSATYMEEEFDHRPTEDEIRSTVITWHNRETDKDILSGFTYENVPVWLSSENQFNYKAAYDLAVQKQQGRLFRSCSNSGRTPNRSIASLLHWKT